MAPDSSQCSKLAPFCQRCREAVCRCWIEVQAELPERLRSFNESEYGTKKACTQSPTDASVPRSLRRSEDTQDTQDVEFVQAVIMRWNSLPPKVPRVPSFRVAPVPSLPSETLGAGLSQTKEMNETVSQMVVEWSRRYPSDRKKDPTLFKNQCTNRRENEEGANIDVPLSPSRT